MSFINRLGTLVKADAHGIVDSLEDRALLLKQHVREAEAELVRKRARRDALRVERGHLEETVARLGAQMEALEADIELSIQSAKEDLARFAVRRLLGVRRESARGRERLESVGAELKELEESLESQEAAFEELQQRVRAWLARAEARAAAGEDPFGRGAAATAEATVADEEVELELLRRTRKAGEGV